MKKFIGDLPIAKGKVQDIYQVIGIGEKPNDGGDGIGTPKGDDDSAGGRVLSIETLKNGLKKHK